MGGAREGKRCGREEEWEEPGRGRGVVGKKNGRSQGGEEVW